MAPRIPRYQRQVAPDVASAPRALSAAEDISGLANGLNQAAAAISQVHQQELADANRTALIEADTQLGQWQNLALYDPNNGALNRKGQAALGLSSEVLGQFDRQTTSIIDGMRNEQQRTAFKQAAAQRRQQLESQLGKYEFGQQQAYKDSVDDSSIKLSMDDALLNYTDPQAVANSRAKLFAVIERKAQRNGWSKEETDLQTRAYDSSLTAQTIQQVAASDPLAAMAMYQRDAGRLTSGDAFQLQKVLGDTARKSQALSISSSLWSGDGAPGPALLPDLVIQQESGGKTDAVSPKGARGLMQLLPSTAEQMAKELGIPYDQAKLTSDPQYNVTLGTAFLNKMLGQFGGSTVAALAAYNAGPGMVEDWINGTNKTGKNPDKLQLPDPRAGGESAARFAEGIPFKETRDYVESIALKASVPSKSLPIDPTPTQLRANALAGAERITDPAMKSLVLSDIEDKYRAAQARVAATYEQAAQYVVNGGLISVPPQVLASLPADEVVKLQRMDEHQRKGTEPRTDYTKFEEFLSMAPGKLASLSLAMDIRPYLGNSEFSTVRDAWQKARDGDPSVQGLAKAENDYLVRSMQVAGIATGKDKEALKPDNLKLQDDYRAAYASQRKTFVAKNNRDPSLEEAQGMMDVLRIETSIKGNWGTAPLWKIKPEDRVRAYIDKGDLKVSQIPAAQRAKIVQALRAKQMDASEENIVNSYVLDISGLGATVK